jgi:hypothetical protein
MFCPHCMLRPACTNYTQPTTENRLLIVVILTQFLLSIVMQKQTHRMVNGRVCSFPLKKSVSVDSLRTVIDIWQIIA